MIQLQVVTIKGKRLRRNGQTLNFFHWLKMVKTYADMLSVVYTCVTVYMALVIYGDTSLTVPRETLAMSASVVKI